MRRKGRNIVSFKSVESAHVPDLSLIPGTSNLVPKGSPANPEPFVTANEAATFLCLKARRVLEMARLGQLPAHPLGIGKRRTWRFRLSELAHALAANSDPQRSDSIYAGKIGRASCR